MWRADAAGFEHSVARCSTAAITASRAPLLLNLGGDPLSEAVSSAASNRHVAFVQTNLDQADSLATALHERIAADTIVITLGRHGVFARTATGTVHVSTDSPSGSGWCERDRAVPVPGAQSAGQRSDRA
ncbi:hypothetical protein [Micromonospora sp. LOL_024]|uniref:hypothetical protein n=1 Tax=Micromonospora sp. LOL_024 TaxID=3345412 RepID=UPI003A8A075A